MSSSSVRNARGVLGQAEASSPSSQRQFVRLDPRKLRRQLKLGMVALVLVVFLMLLVAPGLLTSQDPIATGTSILQGPTPAHWFGTDQLGRDVFSRVVYGSRPVLIASLLGVALATVGGVVVGILGGFAPRLVRGLVMRVVDVLLALPILLIALILIATIGSGIFSIVITVGISFTPGFARVVEASVRKFRSMEYVQAATVFGMSRFRTSLKHLLPNLATEVVVLASSGIGWAVLTATTLSFLGLGVQLPAADWGSDLAAGATYLSTSWWLATLPGLAITVTILVTNFLGDYFTSVLDPRGRVGSRQGLGSYLGRIALRKTIDAS